MNQLALRQLIHISRHLIHCSNKTTRTLLTIFFFIHTHPVYKYISNIRIIIVLSSFCESRKSTVIVQLQLRICILRISRKVRELAVSHLPSLI